MNDNTIPYLAWEVTRHRDGRWVWPKTDDEGPSAPVWLSTVVIVAALLLS